jgi:hypothetical protein
VFEPGARGWGLAVLAVLAALSLWKAISSGLEIFAVYGTVYSALTLCALEGELLPANVWTALLMLATVLAAAGALWNIHGRMKSSSV